MIETEIKNYYFLLIENLLPVAKQRKGTHFELIHIFD